MLDPVTNFGIVEVSTGYDDSATSIALATGDGAKLPQPSTDGAFNLVWYNATDYAAPHLDPNREIVRCTARSTDTLTVTRAQEGTSASTKNTSAKTYVMVLAVTKKTRDDINSALLSPALTLPTTDHTSVGPNTSVFNAGTTITVMQLLYLASDGEWAIADADAVSTAGGLLSIALASGTDGNALSVALPGSFVRDDTWNWTPGATLYVSTTAGDITATAPSATDDVVREIGHAVTADVIFFNPANRHHTVV